MKRNVILFAAFVSTVALLLTDASLSAHSSPDGKPLDARTEAVIRQSVPVCAGMTLTGTEVAPRFPQGFSGLLIRAGSENHACDGQWVLVTSPAGTHYLGYPWFLSNTPGATSEEKLKNFAWTNMQSHFTATIGRTRSPEGLFPVTMTQTTEAGKIETTGLIDADGLVFFPGRFLPRDGDGASLRKSAVEPFLAGAPARGAARADVTVVEFSDFQCPSCKRSQSVGESIVARHGDRVRYVRFDLPLITSHPWAFSAAVAGRAVHRQKPDLFWEYKKQVYENQDRLNSFIFDEFARNFAEDRGLDMQRYDADVASPEPRADLLKAAGAAFSSQIGSTPTFMVNGVLVTPGPDGKDLQGYVDQLLAKE